MDTVESEQKEIVLIRNHKAIARLVPEPAAQNALEVFGDLYRTLDEATADALSTAVQKTKNSRRSALGELL